MTILPEGMPAPFSADDDLDAPYWRGTRKEILKIQKCRHCGALQWGAEWLCNKCLSFDLDWVEIAGKGRIYSWERVWHPVHPALNLHGPYLLALIELPHADNVRMVGNLTGDPMQSVSIGDEVEAVFEHHDNAEPPFTLVHWRRTSEGN